MNWCMENDLPSIVLIYRMMIIGIVGASDAWRPIRESCLNKSIINDCSTSTIQYAHSVDSSWLDRIVCIHDICRYECVYQYVDS